ncbi:MAG: type II toxin-antitoxin system RelE/ParE family toxin [Blautia sp.]|nr:type II toxin-antitoxin system RelE/ParE family toxin [Holdemanella sp.]MCF0133850.1 type II toxin-antitoxin system RelE/ParE family toxin [Blautia sp.]
MNWKVVFLPEAEKDLTHLDGSQRVLIQKAIKKISRNPLPDIEGGYGKPLGNHSRTNLSGFLKVKLKNAGLRIVYKLIRTDTEMLIVVIGARADDEVYKQAQSRADKHSL